jgi:hypothetical protein
MTDKTTIARLLEQRANTFKQRDDILYKKGKADGWPKEVMDYIMWHEHENARSIWALQDLAKQVRKLP